MLKVKKKSRLGKQHSVQFNRSVMSDSLWPHEPQHARPPCPSPTPGVYPDSCPLSRWCHPTISSSVVPFSSCPQSLPASGSFQMSQLFTSGGQSIGLSASTLLIKSKKRTNIFNIHILKNHLRLNSQVQSSKITLVSSCFRRWDFTAKVVWLQAER